MSVFFEDLPVGQPVEIGSWTFTAEDIITYGRQYDPQPFHTDEIAAKDSFFGGLCASGWHVCATFIRLSIHHHEALSAGMAARGEPVASLGGSPGLSELRWIRPVRVNDRLTYFATVASKRISGSRPKWGIVTEVDTAVNQHGEPVLSMTGTYFLERRSGA